MAGTQWIVKLIPIGNTEDNLFALETVGGTGVEDFAGWHLDPFSFTTDAAGQAAVTLRHTPTAITSVYCLTAEDLRILAPAGLAGAVLTVQKRKLLYDKPATPINAVSNAPSGVSVASASGQLTGDSTSTGTVSVSTTPATGAGGGADNAISAASATVTMNAHHHTVDILYDHKHTLTFAATAIKIADLEATTMLVLYR